MKGIILGLNPDVHMVDICNHVSPQNVLEASLYLSMAQKFFPPGTIHLAVVDPEVGSNQRPIMVITDEYYFIGPDNGIFTYIYKQPHQILKVLHITAEHYFLSPVAQTFHGRDIFAPVAGWFSRGIDSSSIGKEITDYKSLKIHEPQKIMDSTLEGEILTIDSFGNAITNFTKSHLLELFSEMSQEGHLNVICKGQKFTLARQYVEAKDKGPSALINSFELLELFIYKGNVSQKLGLKPSDKVGIMIS
jgi:S-adenosylmethionine hydrolase